MPPETIESSNSRFNPKTSIAILIALLILIGGGYYFYTKNTATPTAEPTITIGDEGVYLTLRTNKLDFVPGLFILNPKDRTLHLVKDDGFTNTTGSMSDDGATFVYARQVNDVETQIVMKIIASGEEKEITKSNGVFLKREPRVSPQNDRIVFTGRKSSLEVSANPDEWNVYTTDINGNEELVTTGTHPQWLADGKSIAVLRSDGIYTYNLESGTEEHAVITKEKLTLGDTFDISGDSKYLAFSERERDRVYILQVNTFEPFEATTFQKIDLYAYGLVFSPNSTGLLVHEVDHIDNTFSNPKLVIYELETQKKLLVSSLDEYDLNYTSLTDWR